MESKSTVNYKKLILFKNLVTFSILNNIYFVFL
jgi:hypothetical protein